MKVSSGTCWRRWLHWSRGSVNRRIFATIIIIGWISLFVNLASVLKELVVAHQFGRGDELDAFVIAFLLPSFAINVAAGSLNSAFIPVYIKVREKQGIAVAQQLFSSVMTLSLCLLIAIIIVFAVSIHHILPFLASNFTAEKRMLTERLFFMLLPSILLSGVATLWTAVLNAGERFVMSALAPVMIPAAIIGSILFFGNNWRIFSLAIGTVIGFALQCGLLVVALQHHNIRLQLRWNGMNPEIRNVINQYLPMVAGAFLMSSTGLVDQAMAAMLDPGSVAALSYGNKIISFIIGLGAMAVGTAVLPYFSRMVAEQNWSGVHHTLKTYSRLISLVMVPLTVVLFFMSETIVHFLFERGAFTFKDTKVVGQVQAFYVLQIPWYMCGILAIRLISALQMNQILLLAAALNLIINVGLNYIFMQWFGVAGIALSTAFVYLLSFLYCWIAANNRLSKLMSFDGIYKV